MEITPTWRTRYRLMSMVAKGSTGDCCKTLSNLQRLACLGPMGAMKGTPTAAMEVVLNLQPLDIFPAYMKKAVTLYTDGSKTQKDTGAGVWRARPRASFSISLGKLATVFQAEAAKAKPSTCTRITWCLDIPEPPKENSKCGEADETVECSALHSKRLGSLGILKRYWNRQVLFRRSGRKKCLAGIMVIDSGLVEIVHLQLLPTLNNTGCGMSSSLPSKPTSYHNTRRTQTSFR
ncbi:hypothetical protein J6590_105671 [Homalodisca vitripennis]|nr:hypothetical protein J6590_105671 [Homalodisca vitripennis]